MSYQAFLDSKYVSAPEAGFEPSVMGEHLFGFQREIVAWALRKGRAAMFCDTGTGKTAMQLEWARQIHEHTGGRVLILAPLAVAQQTAREGEKFGVPVTICRSGEDLSGGVNVANYERLHYFASEDFAGLVLDESSILKGWNGKTRRALTEFGRSILYRLACTATPAPNDTEELANHAEFLGAMTGKEMLALFFTQDGNSTHKWRLKNHARRDFWQWVASWAMAVRKPSDLGFDDGAFELPPLSMHQLTTGAATVSDERLFSVEAQTLTERRKARRESVSDRVKRATQLIDESHGLEKTHWLYLNNAESTTGAGTRPIENTSRNTTRSIEKRKIRIGVSDTPTTQSSVRSVENTRATETKPQSETDGCEPSSASTPRHTTDCSPSKAEDARSAVPNSEITENADCTLITATAQGRCGACSALNVTSGSESLAMIPSCSCEQRPTSSNFKGLEPWVVWCGLNAEQHAMERALGNRAISVYGSLPASEKARRLLAWLSGERPVLITKPSVAGMGLNMQHCARMAFVGLSDSFEELYQATRRCWRFGQTRPVEAYVITAEDEGAVVANIRRKEKQASQMMEEIVRHTAKKAYRPAEYNQGEKSGDGWRLLLGDCVERTQELEDESVGLCVFSPPFPGMYAYTDSPRDMGNTRGISEMMEHFGHLIPELHRVTMPGRTCAVHLTQSPTFKSTDGFSGYRDFRGKVIEAMERAGWIYYGEVTIEKDPQVRAIRTKDRGLLFKTLSGDSSHMHMALADYLLQFRKPGENSEPIRAGISEKYDNSGGWITQEEWIEWASPVWFRHREGVRGGIRETNVLNVSAARDAEDERHLAPLQLDVIERAVKLWSNPSDTVLDPFAGICSTGYQALKLGRCFVGVELKQSYYEQGCRNLRRAEREGATGTLFEAVE